MITVRIECECGQPYELKVEPVNGHMPFPAICPRCGADGTAAANASIASQPAASATAPVAVANPEQAQIDARAKISWGDPPDAVIKFLMLQGYDAPTATEIVAGLTRERVAVVRFNGVKKMAIGAALMGVSITTMVFISRGHGPVRYRSAGALIGLGLVGAWFLLNGLIMVIAPKLETSDLADQ